MFEYYYYTISATEYSNPRSPSKLANDDIYWRKVFPLLPKHYGDWVFSSSSSSSNVKYG